MGRIGAVAPATIVRAGQPPTQLPDGARVAFTLPDAAAPGSVGVFRKPSIAAVAADVAPATAVPVGVDVASAGPTQVPTLDEFNALRAIVDQLRTDRDNLQTAVAAAIAVLNRSYMRDDPANVVFGSDQAQGILATQVEGSAVSNLPNLTDASGSATEANAGGNAPHAFELDLGSPLSISAFAMALRIWSGASSGVTVNVEYSGKLAAADGWTALGTSAVPQNLTRTVMPVANPGPWRFVKARVVSGAGRYGLWEAIGAERVDTLTYATAPTAAERIAADLALDS